MGKKRKQTLTAKQGKPQQHSQLNFQDQVAAAVNQKLEVTINQKMNYVASIILRETKASLEDLYARLSTLETLALEKFGVSEDEFALLVSEAEDASIGLEKVDVIEKGDRVRLVVATKTKDQEEFAGSSKTRLEDAGSGNTFGLEIESAILGMKTNETKEIEFGKDKGMVAKLTVLRISRYIKEEVEEVKTDDVKGDEVENTNA